MENKNDFLPQGYEQPMNGNNYMKLKQGENRFRILSKPIIGWLDWMEKKPLRFRMNEKPERAIDPTKPLKHFWAMVVWNYTENCIQILEITQSSIQSAIKKLSADEDWGSPFDYDIKVARVGEKMNTEYTINPVPHKKISDEILVSLKEKPVNLEALYDGADPFDNKPPF